MTAPSAPGGAGQLSVEVVSDLTGFAQKLQAGVDRAARGVAAKIDVAIDQRGLRQKLKENVDKAASNVRAKVGIDVDSRGLRQKLQGEVDKASSNLKANVSLNVDAKGFRQRLRDQVLASAKGLKADVEVGVDAKGLRAALREAVAAASAGLKIRVQIEATADGLREQIRAKTAAASAGLRAKVDTSGSSLGGGGSDLDTNAAARGMGNLRGAAIAAAVALSPVLLSAAAGLVGVLGGPLMGVLGSLPFAFAGVATAAGTLFAVFHGIGAAFKALSEQQSTSAQNAKQTAQQDRAAADQRISAAQGLAHAQRDVTTAVQQAALQQTQAIRAEQAAEENLREAQLAAKNAQEDLTTARRDAARQLQDLNLQIRQGRIDETEATIAVNKAQRDLNNAQNNGATGDILQGYIDALGSARLELERVHTDNQRNEQDYKRTAKAGVDGSRQVRDAQETVRTSLLGVQNAQKDLAESQANVTRTQVQSQQQIADALENLGNAQRAYSESLITQQTATSEAANKVSQALDKLSPKARAFVLTLFGWRTQLQGISHDAQEAFFGKLNPALQRIPALFAPIRQIVGETAGVFGDLTAQGVKMVTSGPWRSDFVALGNASAAMFERVGGDVLKLIDAMRNVAFASLPFVGIVGTLIDKFATWSQRTSAAGRANGTLAATFEKWGFYLQQVVDFVGALGGALIDLGKSATPYILQAIMYTTQLIDKFRAWAKTPKGQYELQQLGQLAGRVLTLMVYLIGQVLVGALKLAVGINRIVTAVQGFLDKHPALQRVANTFGGFAASAGVLVIAAVKLAPLFEALGPALAALVSPVGLVAAGIAGIGIGIAYLYTHNAGFKRWADGFISDAKRVVSSGIGAISRGLKTLGSEAGQDYQQNNAGPLAKLRQSVGSDLDKIGASVRKYFGRGGQFGQDFDQFKQKIGPTVQSIVSAFSNAFTVIIQITRAFVAVVGFLWNTFGSTITTYVRRSFGTLLKFIQGWAQVLNGIFEILAGLLTGNWSKMWKGVRDIFGGFSKQISALVGQFWNAIRFIFGLGIDAITTVWKAFWGDIKQHAINGWNDMTRWFGTALSAFEYGFNVVISSIGKAWNGLINLLKTPVRVVVNDVIGPFVDAINFVGKPFSLSVSKPHLPKGFAVGGAVPGPDQGRDTQRIAVRGQEHVFTPEEVAGAGGGSISRGHQALISLRSALVGGKPVGTSGNGGGYSTGGMVDRFLDRTKDPAYERGGVPGFGIIKKIGSSLSGAALSALKQMPGIGPLATLGDTEAGQRIMDIGASKLLDAAVAPLKQLLAGLGKTIPAKLVQNSFNTLVDRAKAVLDSDQTSSDVGGDWRGALGGAIGAIIDVMRQKSGINGWVVTSSLRPGDPGYHGSGNAVDFGWPGNDPAGLTRIARFWDRYRSDLLEEIYSGDGGHFAKFGQTVSAGYYGAETVSQHYNHVHIAATLAAMQRVLSGAGSAIAGGVGGTIQRALQIAHEPASWATALQILLNKETSGGQDLTNTGYTAANGEHPTGPAQFLPSTFRQFAVAGYTNIHALLDSLIAAARRIDLVWHGPQNIPGLLGGGQYQGYAQGGTLYPVPGGHVVKVAEAGKAETITDTASLNAWGARVDAKLDELAAHAGGITQYIYPSKGMSEIELGKKAGREVGWQVRR